jgi:hypothetical protein
MRPRARIGAVQKKEGPLSECCPKPEPSLSLAPNLPAWIYLLKVVLLNTPYTSACLLVRGALWIFLVSLLVRTFGEFANEGIPPKHPSPEYPGSPLEVRVLLGDSCITTQRGPRGVQQTHCCEEGVAPYEERPLRPAGLGAFSWRGSSCSILRSLSQGGYNNASLLFPSGRFGGWVICPVSPATN